MGSPSGIPYLLCVQPGCGGRRGLKGTRFMPLNSLAWAFEMNISLHPLLVEQDAVVCGTEEKASNLKKKSLNLKMLRFLLSE